MLPATMGAVVATGNHLMLLVVGDAGMMMRHADLDTVVRYNVLLLAVVPNDD